MSARLFREEAAAVPVTQVKRSTRNQRAAGSQIWYGEAFAIAFISPGNLPHRN